MALKLLTRKDEPLEDASLGIRLRLGRLRPEHIAEISGLLATSRAPAVAIGIHVLREVASELSVAGEDYDPRALSYQIDTRDADNVAVLTGIAALAIEELFADEAAKKKSSAPRAPSGAASDAAPAR